MSENHPTGRSHRHGACTIVRSAGVLAVVAAALLGVGAGPAAARPDAGDPAVRVGHLSECLLQRVGDQLVRCDVLTGNGVQAPAYVPER